MLVVPEDLSLGAKATFHIRENHVLIGAKTTFLLSMASPSSLTRCRARIDLLRVLEEGEGRSQVGARTKCMNALSVVAMSVDLASGGRKNAV